MLREVNSESGWTRFLPLANNALFISENLRDKNKTEEKNTGTLFD
jgi:hypothetical protein